MGKLEEILEGDNSGKTVSDVVKELISTEKNLSSKTELSPIQVLTFTKAEAWSERYNSALGKIVIKYYKENLISLNRQGRTELVEVMKGAMQHEAEMNRPKIQL